MTPRTIQPIWNSLSAAVALGCAGSTVAAVAGAVVDRQSAAMQLPASLLVGAVAGDPGDTDRLIRRLDPGGRPAIRLLNGIEMRRLIGENGTAAGLPLPTMLEVTAEPGELRSLASRLNGQPGLMVGSVTMPETPAAPARPAGLLAVFFALGGAGWAAHHHVRRRAPLLLLLHRLGATPGRLLAESLAGVLASAALGVSAGGATAAAMLPARLFAGHGAILFAVPLLVAGAAMLGGLGSLRRLMAALS